MPVPGQITVESLIVTDQLATRPPRTPNYQTENEALVALAQALAERSDDILHKLAEQAMRLCDADSAGVSILEEENGVALFRWRAIHGKLRPFLNGTMPRDFSPCGEVVDQKKPLLMQHPIRLYHSIKALEFDIHEVLLVPFFQGPEIVGTLWVVAHDSRKIFDREDLRCLQSLCAFASASTVSLQNMKTLEDTSQRLQDIQARMDTALGIGAIATWVWDMDANRVFADRHLDTIFGVSTEDAAGGKLEHYLNAIHADDLKLVDQAIQKAKETHGLYEAEYRIRIEGQPIRWVSARGRVLKGDEQHGNRLIGVIMDITERRQMEDKLRIRTEQLAEASQRKDEFLATLSHELRSPLNIIQGHTELLRLETPGTQEFEESLDAIERSARLQTQLIADMLDVSRIITGKMLLDISVFDPKEIVMDAMRAIQFAADARSISLHYDVESSIGTINGDRGRLQQALWNLLVNAVKFSPTGSRVFLQVSLRKGFMEFQVRDQGEGISAEFLPHVFDRFHQEDGSKSRKYGGLGLGLAIVRHIAELHGGTVRATSPGKDQGSSFTLSIPVVAVLDDLHERSTSVDGSSSPPQYERAPGLPDYRILVVDDQTEASVLLKRSFERLGAQVFTANSAVSAWKILEEQTLDILISDIGMPEHNGYDLIRTWRRKECMLNRTTLPAIALTAYGTREDRNEILAAGFHAHLAKPVGLRELATTIIEVVRTA